MHPPPSDGSAPPLVTIVVPAYNAGRYLRQSLDSLLAQRYQPIEILVMDDASSDETERIMAGYAGRVRYHRQPANRGQFDNVNDGIAMAAGELIAVFHADDVYLPEIVEREVEFLRAHPEAGAVFCLDVFIDETGREYHRLQLPPELRGGGVFAWPRILDALLRHNNTFLRTPGTMVRASTYRRVGPYRPQFESCADFDMWVRIARAGSIGIIDEHLYRYRHVETQASRQYQRLRVAPSRNFEILDTCLATDAPLASADALRDYEAHRAEDTIMRAASLYIRGELRDARALLAGVRGGVLRASRRPNRRRLMALLVGLRAVTRLPRITPLAEFLRRRWHGGAPRTRARDAGAMVA